MLGTHEEYQQRASAVWRGTSISIRLNTQIKGNTNIHSLTDSAAGAGGARAFSDGVDLGGELANSVSRWGNAERHERAFPIVYLYRQFLTDSGGPGTYRGGVGHEFALTSTNSEAPVEVTTFGKGGSVPQALGLFGGYPGCTVEYRIHRSDDVWNGPLERHNSQQEDTEDAQWGSHDLREGDRFYVRSSGSGGYGDPLKRDPDDVVADVEKGTVSPRAAEEVYGVALTEGELGHDEEETRRRRRERYQERLQTDNAFESPVASTETTQTGRKLSGSINIAKRPDSSERFHACTHCETVLTEIDTNWKENVIVSESDPSNAGPHRESRDDLVLREFVCFECGSLLDTEVALADDPYLSDTVC
jgi:N-methylhydantoinase B